MSTNWTKIWPHDLPTFTFMMSRSDNLLDNFSMKINFMCVSSINLNFWDNMCLNFWVLSWPWIRSFKKCSTSNFLYHWSLMKLIQNSTSELFMMRSVVLAFDLWPLDDLAKFHGRAFVWSFVTTPPDKPTNKQTHILVQTEAGNRHKANTSSGEKKKWTDNAKHRHPRRSSSIWWRREGREGRGEGTEEGTGRGGGWR